MMNMKVRVDSLEQQLRYRDAYWDNVKKVLTGDLPTTKDTTNLEVPNLEKSTD